VDSAEHITKLITDGTLRIGGEDKLSDLRGRFPQVPTDEEGKKELDRRWADFVKETRIRIGTILKSQRISILLGAGASRDAGGPVLATIPIEVEDELASKAIDDKKIEAWLVVFYIACARIIGDEVPVVEEAIRDRLATEDRKPLAANYERVLFILHVWEEALLGISARISGLADGVNEIDRDAVTACREQLVSSLITRCDLSYADDDQAAPNTHREMIRRLLTRPTNLQRVGVFTVNYDTLIEQAADAEGAVLVDGFVGNVNRVFRPESYDYDLYFPAETTEGPIHRLDRVLQLYKLHGSINWRSVEESWINPFGIESQGKPVEKAEAAVIYPTPAKHGDALAMPYAELFRRFAASVVRPQSVLITIGYGFPDEHLNAIIRQALAIPSFTLIVVDPEPTSDFVGRLKERDDQRIWLFGGALGYFDRFVRTALPDLRESDVERKVIETFNATQPDTDTQS
jgi:SIR2-like domain